MTAFDIRKGVKPPANQQSSNVTTVTIASITTEFSDRGQPLPLVANLQQLHQQSNNSTLTNIENDNKQSIHKLSDVKELQPLCVCGPSHLRQLIPIASCLISFAFVLSILIILMDPTEFRHQQFRLNMSRDYDLIGVPQDDPTLLTFIREIHMKRYPMPFMKGVNEHTNFSDRHSLAIQMARYIERMLSGKRNGVFVQSLPGSSGTAMTAPYLLEKLGWGGVIVEPAPQKYFKLLKSNAQRTNVQIVHACVSPNIFPKEVTVHQEVENQLRINGLFDEKDSDFNPRVKCFPLYSLMLAVDHCDVDVLSLGCQGQELQILETLPFEHVRIRIITIHLDDYFEHYKENDLLDGEQYVQNITDFLHTKSYQLVKTIKNNYIYQLLATDKPITVIS